MAEGLDIEDKEEDLVSSEDDTDNDNFIHKPHFEYKMGSGDVSYTHSEDSDLIKSLSGKEEEFTKIINEKRGRGRPKKTDIIRPEIALNSNIDLNFSEKRGRGRPKISERKGPGRPKKIASFISDDSQEESSAPEKVSKRGRGRPKKINNSIDLTSEDDFEQCKQSSSKSNIDQHGVIKRGPGRPKKVALTLDMTCDEEDGTGISGITIEGWEGFAGGIHQSKECPIDILCNGSLPKEEQDDIAKCPPDSTEVVSYVTNKKMWYDCQ